jgi:hypothetical protein
MSRDMYSSSFWLIMQEAQVYTAHATPSGSDKNMAGKLGAECPCGFSFVTPHGQDDAVAVLQLHVNRVHKADYPQGISRADVIAKLKEVK